MTVVGKSINKLGDEADSLIRVADDAITFRDKRISGKEQARSRVQCEASHAEQIAKPEYNVELASHILAQPRFDLVHLGRQSRAANFVRNRVQSRAMIDKRDKDTCCRPEADARGEEKMSVRNFSKLFDEKVEAVGINPQLVKRSLNEGFSGGEKKRHEMLQLEVLRPARAILDETDSGLDVDALRIVAEGVNSMRSPDRSFIIVTHYQRLLNYIKPDIVHILIDGRIVKTGGAELALEVEKDGYKGYSSVEVSA